MSEYPIVTRFTLVHALAGYCAATVFDLTALEHFIAHVIFEICENTWALPFFQWLDTLDPWRSEPYVGDSLGNSTADVLAGMCGFALARR